jgi:hypothetical protein
VRLLSSEPCPECKSVKLPRSELSALWQYTAKHKLGDLSCHDGTNTPYRPAPVTKYNSFICSNNPRRIDSNEVSGKRMRLFEETPSSECNETIAFPSASVLVSMESLVLQRSRFMKERDDAIAEQSHRRQRLEAVEQERDQARLEVEKAVLECAEQCRVLQSKLSILRQKYIYLIEENEVLAQNNNNLQQTLVQCQQKQSNLSSRVTALEVQQES